MSNEEDLPHAECAQSMHCPWHRRHEGLNRSIQRPQDYHRVTRSKKSDLVRYL